MYDLIIIGSGPAGYTAAIYAARYKLNVIVIGVVAGGAMAEAHLIENWPGINSISGAELAKNFKKHVEYFNIPIESTSVKSVAKYDNIFNIATENGKKFRSKTILIAAGSKKRKLGISGESELNGKGVSYCATCDARFFKKKTVAVVGGNDSAGDAALLLADHADRVYLIYRNKPLRCEPITFEQIKKNNKIEIVYNTNITKINGEKFVESVELDNEFNNSKNLKVDGVFIEIGATPAVDLAKNLGVETDNLDRIKISRDCSTNIKGVFAAGDITVGLYNLKQIVTASASGAIAAASANKFVKTQKNKNFL